MDTLTKEMIEKYKIKKLKYDFMGYTFKDTKDLSFHHLIVPKRDCKKLGWGQGRFVWNGAILKQDTAHDYLHLIENIDRDMFIAITRELTEMLRKNRTIDWQNKESARANMRRMVKRLLKKYDYPPKEIQGAIDVVIHQCELWTDNAEW